MIRSRDLWIWRRLGLRWSSSCPWSPANPRVGFTYSEPPDIHAAIPERLHGPFVSLVRSHARGWLEGSGSSTFPPFGADKAKRGERRGKRESLRETENWAESDSALSEGVPGIDSNPAAAQADAKRPPAQLKRCTPLKVPWSTAPTRAGAPPYSAPNALESGCLTTPSPLTPRDMLTGPRLAPHPPTPACRTGLAPGSRY